MQTILSDAEGARYARHSMATPNVGRYRVVVWHGESGSRFYVVDSKAPEDEQPAVVASRTQRPAAQAIANRLNGC